MVKRVFVVDDATFQVLLSTWDDDPDNYPCGEGRMCITSFCTGEDIECAQLDPGLEDQDWYWNSQTKEFQNTPVV
jgi:hypothetical protein